MIVGKVENAKLIKPGWNPTPSIYDLNRKSEPEEEKPINILIDWSRNEKIGAPKGVFKINNAKISWNISPYNTVLILIADLFSDSSNAIESRVNKPRIPRRLPIIYYRFGWAPWSSEVFWTFSLIFECSFNISIIFWSNKSSDNLFLFDSFL